MTALGHGGSSASPLLKRLGVLLLVGCLVLLGLISTRPDRIEHASIFAEYKAYSSDLSRLGNSSLPASDRAGDKYLHQQPLHLPKESISQRQCDRISTYQLQKLIAAETDLTANSAPMVFHFRYGALVGQDQTIFEAPAEFCSVILAPQSAWENSTKQLAIEGFGPDSIHAEIKSDDIRIIFQEPDYWGMLLRTDNSSVVPMAVYTLPYALNHPGRYQMEAEIEFQNYDWVKEQDLDIPKVPFPMVMTNIDIKPRSPAISITGKPISRPKTQCYTDGASRDYRGRWYRASSFAKDGNQTALNAGAHLDFADHNTTVDELGWTFAPDHCFLLFFTPEEHMSCLANRSVQVLGDSNSRRVMKSVISGGVNWCQDPTNRTCQCSDSHEEYFTDALNKTVSLERFERTDTTDDPTFFGRNGSIFFDFVGGLIVPRPDNPWSKYYDHWGFDGSSITERRIRVYGAPDLVHVSFIGYDTTLLHTTQRVEDALPHFRDTLHTAHPPGTRFIHRLANSMCCGNEATNHRWTTPRFRIFNHMWRSWWARDEAAGVVRVVDASVLQGRKELERAHPCLSTHMRASTVRLEALMWMTATCDKGRDGETATMRDWGLKA